MNYQYIEVPDIFVNENENKSYYLHRETGTIYEIKEDRAWYSSLASCIPSIYGTTLIKKTLNVWFKYNKPILNRLFIEYDGYYPDGTKLNPTKQGYYLIAMPSDFNLSEEWQALTPLNFKGVDEY